MTLAGELHSVTILSYILFLLSVSALSVCIRAIHLLMAIDLASRVCVCMYVFYLAFTEKEIEIVDGRDRKSVV